jgi:hypothetical protein
VARHFVTVTNHHRSRPVFFVPPKLRIVLKTVFDGGIADEEILQTTSVDIHRYFKHC